MIDGCNVISQEEKQAQSWPVLLIQLGSGFMLIFCLAANSFAADMLRGKNLHQENCQRCHQSAVYTRPERIVEDLPGLRKRISECELSNSLLWFDEEIDDVTAYLNHEFYQFGVK